MSQKPPRLTSMTRLREEMGAYFADLRRAAVEHTAPVAWCTSVGPAEILRALGFAVYFPENHGAMLGATRMANQCIGRAHARGYSPDVCSYLCSDVGAYLTKQTPLSGFGFDAIPKADVLVFNTNQCRDVRDWFSFYAREWDVPLMGITARRDVDEVTDDLVDSDARQFERLVPALESIAGQRLDAARLTAAMNDSRQCSQLWRACLDTAVAEPSPISFFDCCILMGPAVVLRGAPEAPAFYLDLLLELQSIARLKDGAVHDEQFRLYWDGMPIWGRLRALSDLFASQRACVVASTYCDSWVFDALDPADPFRSMARASLELFIARSEEPKERAIAHAVERFAIDGVVFHDARTCPNNSNTRYGMPARLRDRLGVPVLTIDGDLNDLRCFSQEQTATNVEGFVEQLADFASA
ncbi:MAG: 2-hydroxyacyl-CoA dehydratase subunit D [Planctomycetota bacterium]